MKVRFAIEVRSGGRNEDRAAHFAVQDVETFALADGAGGTGLGAVAAECVIREAQALALGRHRSATEALLRADAELARLGCLSTGVIVQVRDGNISGASCGDSVAWLIDGDHVLELTELQSRKPLLGDGGTPVSFGTIGFSGVLMLASDGLVNYSSRQPVLEYVAAGSVEDAAKAVAELPRMKSGAYQDDVSVIICRANPCSMVERSPSRMR